MINSNYKKYIGYITAGLFGVLLVIGLRGASAATPTDLPSSNVTPNFSGLNISGSVDVGGGVNVGSVVTAPQLNTEAIGDQGGDGMIDIEGGITVENPISNKFGDLEIDDNLVVSGKTIVNGANGLDVNGVGGLKVSKDIDVGGYIRNSAKNSNGDSLPVYISDSLNFTENKNLVIPKGKLFVTNDDLDFNGDPQNALNVDGFITINNGGILTSRCDNNSNAEPYYCVTIGYTGDDVHTASIFVNGPLLIAGAIKRKDPISADPLLIDDDLDVTGTTSIDKDLKVKGIISNPIANSAKVYEFMTVLQSSKCKLNVKKSATTIYTQNVVDTNNDGKETVNVTIEGDDLSTTILFPACTADPVKQTVKIGNLKIKDDVILEGDLNASSMQVSGKASFLGDIEFAKPLQLTSELQNIAGDVIINDNLDVRDEIVNNDGTNLIRIGKGNQPTKLDVTGAFSAPAATFSQDVTVNAKFKANQIGKFTINTSAKKTLSAGQTSTITSSCPTTPNKAKIISCGFAQETTNSDVYLLELKPESFNTGDDCIAKAVNKGTGTKYGYGYAVCFDPKSN